MGKLIDLVGQKFNKLTVVSWAGNSKWNCLCECGNMTKARGNGLKSGHRYSCGCATRCGDGNRKTVGEFVQEAAQLGLDKLFDYSQVDYWTCKTPVKIKCLRHDNWFEQTPQEHLKGSGCRKCRSEKCSASSRKTLEEFIEKACSVHGDVKYNYSQVDYISNKKKVILSCNDCGHTFQQTPDSHLSGHGCKPCANVTVSRKKLWTVERFAEEAKKVHGDKYTYNSVEYKGSVIPVNIFCNCCGSYFLKPPAHILQGLGCPCQNAGGGGFSANKDGVLYVLKSDTSTKIGITNRTAETRCIAVNRSSGMRFTVVKEFPLSGRSCRKLERALLDLFKKTYERHSFKFDGSTETFIGLDSEDAVEIIDCLINLGVK